MNFRFPSPVYEVPGEPTGGGTPSAAPVAAGASPSPPSPTGSGTPPAPVAAPEGPLAAYWDSSKSALKLEDLSKAFAERDAVFTANAERAKAVPEKPEAYKAELPKDFQTPQGMEIKFDDALLTEARTLAHALQIPQTEFSKLLALDAKFKIASAQKALNEHKAMVDAENKKLGDGAAARRAAIETFAKANLIEDERAEVTLLLSTEAGIRALEKLIAKANGNGMPSRDPNQKTLPVVEKSIAERMYPNLPSGLPPASARSA